LRFPFVTDGRFVELLATRRGNRPASSIRSQKDSAAASRRLRAMGPPRIALLLGPVALAACGASQRPAPTPTPAPAPVTPAIRTVTAVPPARPAVVVGLRIVRIVDATRRIRLRGGRLVPRTLVTYVRYPAFGPPGKGDVPGARPAGRFPLIVFGHGFNVTPTPYDELLRAWARAGYVVAAPVFPLENPLAPGGPNEADLVNQPRDVSVVITRLLADARLTRHAVAVAGQSDGGDTALTVAYRPQDRDRRIDAAVILSGMEIPGVGGYSFPAGGPPLLAVQGTNDAINPPQATQDFFDAASRPKYLLRLLGAGHLPPYTTEQPQLRIVEQVTTAFLDLYLKRRPAAVRRLRRAGSVPGIATLQAEPLA
jgi:dienelactone hydrolase